MESSEQAVAAFHSVAEIFADQDVVLGKTFGAAALMLNKKAIGCLHGEKMAFKLGRDSARHAEALSLPGATLFDPSGMGRPFKDWVEIPLAEAADWLDFGRAAVQAQQSG
ncbi:hypothetical protein [Psychromicrobium lacuslunae]|uniref:TfoX N-terminal domain-containing protein n=1 Tax=Psychromicrobium lacuslunae TaxID=1618207 RepID=A0A0D4C1J5_9MICC|nr:hypothetical protein [Psychromicrobium lacuslunae]AJT42527.1 hypothetical protein UM93_15410 [Psychromicrobium lacuslunae]